MSGVPGHRALRQTGAALQSWEPGTPQGQHLAPKDRRRARGCRGPGRASGATQGCPRLSRAEVRLRASGPALRVIKNDPADRCVLFVNLLRFIHGSSWLGPSRAASRPTCHRQPARGRGTYVSAGTTSVSQGHPHFSEGAGQDRLWGV